MSHQVVRGLLWLAFLLVMLGGGRYHDFIADWQVWLVIASAIAVTVSTVAAAASRGQDCDHVGHDHAGDGRPSWRGTLMHAVPLYAALVLGRDASLGSQAVARAGVWMPTGEKPVQVIPDFMPSFTSTPKESAAPLPPGTVTDLSVPMKLDLHRLYQPGAFPGVERVVVVGKISKGFDSGLMKPEMLPADIDRGRIHGTIYRFVMMCCAADARPVQVVLLGEAPPAGLSRDSWVEAKGVWLRPKPGGLAGLVVEHWQEVQAPAQEYLSAY